MIFLVSLTKSKRRVNYEYDKSHSRRDNGHCACLGIIIRKNERGGNLMNKYIDKNAITLGISALVGAIAFTMFISPKIPKSMGGSK